MNLARFSHGGSPASAYLLYTLSALFGAGSLVAFAVFLYRGPFHVVDLRLSGPGILVFDAALSLVFFLQHSVMTRSGFRRRLSSMIRNPYHPAIYSAASGVVLLVVVVLWQDSQWTLLSVQGPARWALRGAYLAAAVGFVWGARALGKLDTFGLKAIVRHLRDRKPREMPFTLRGPYRWVRHPLYLFTLVFFWSFPDLTADRLLFNLLWTAWVFLGTVLEERDLVELFGRDYREYQRDVPMILPLRIGPTRKR
jgi:protein-S-isoprenylcysteine O-methyltransferase Ste14